MTENYEEADVYKRCELWKHWWFWLLQCLNGSTEDSDTKVNALVDNENSAAWQKIMKKLMTTKGVNFGNIDDSDYCKRCRLTKDNEDSDDCKRCILTKKHWRFCWLEKVQTDWKSTEDSDNCQKGRLTENTEDSDGCKGCRLWLKAMKILILTDDTEDCGGCKD